MIRPLKGWWDRGFQQRLATDTLTDAEKGVRSGIQEVQKKEAERRRKFAQEIVNVATAVDSTEKFEDYLRENVLNEHVERDKALLDILNIAAEKIELLRRVAVELHPPRVRIYEGARIALTREVIRLRVALGSSAKSSDVSSKEQEKRKELSPAEDIAQKALDFGDEDLFERYLRGNVIDGEKVKSEQAPYVLRAAHAILLEKLEHVREDNNEKREVIEKALAVLHRVLRDVHTARDESEKETERVGKDAERDMRLKTEQTTQRIHVMLDKLFHANLIGPKESRAVLDDVDSYINAANESADQYRFAYLQMSLATTLHTLQDVERKNEPSSELLAELSRRAYDELYSQLREAAGSLFSAELDSYALSDERDIVSVFTNSANIERMRELGLTVEEQESFRLAAGFLKQHQSDYQLSSSSAFATKQFAGSFDKFKCRMLLKNVTIALDKAQVRRMRDELVSLHAALWDARVYTYTPEVILDKMMKKADEQYQAGFRNSYVRLRPRLEEELRLAQERLTAAHAETSPERRLEERGERFISTFFEAFPALCATTEYRFLPRSNLMPKDVSFGGDFSNATFEQIIGDSRALLRQLAQNKTDSDSYVVKHDLLQNFTRLVDIEFGERQIHKCNPSFYLSNAKWPLIFLLERVDEGIHAPSDAEAALSVAVSALKALSENITHIEPNTRVAHLRHLSEFRSFVDQYVAPGIHNKFSSSKRVEELFGEIQEALKSVARMIENTPEELAYDRSKTFQNILKTGIGVEGTPEEIRAQHMSVYKDALAEFEKQEKIAGTALNGEIITGENIESELRTLHRHTMDRLATVDFPYTLDKPLSIKRVPSYLQSSWPIAAYHQGSIYVHQKQALDRSLLRLLFAHEGVPGHALHENLLSGGRGPIERHLENPLSYEGWAVYSEKLTTELAGADVSPEVRAAELATFNKYLALRAARGLIDLAVNYFGTDPYEIIDAFPWQENRPELEAVIADVTVNPGEYIPYITGFDAVDQLYKVHGVRLGPEEFFKAILGNGQPSWSTIAKLLEKRQ